MSNYFSPRSIKLLGISFCILISTFAFQHCGQYKSGSIGSSVPGQNSAASAAPPPETMATVQEDNPSGSTSPSSNSNTADNSASSSDNSNTADSSTNSSGSNSDAVGCAAGSKTWSYGGPGCAVNYPALNAGSGVLSDTFGKYHGSIAYSCKDGVVTFNHSTAICGTFENNQIVVTPTGATEATLNPSFEDCYSNKVKEGVNHLFTGGASLWGTNVCAEAIICQKDFQRTQAQQPDYSGGPPPPGPNIAFPTCEPLQRGSCDIKYFNLNLTKAINHYTTSSPVPGTISYDLNTTIACGISIVAETLVPGDEQTYSCTVKYKTSKSATAVEQSLSLSAKLKCQEQSVSSTADNGSEPFSYKNIVVEPLSNVSASFYDYFTSSQNGTPEVFIPQNAGGIKFLPHPYQGTYYPKWCSGLTCYSTFHKLPANGY